MSNNQLLGGWSQFEKLTNEDKDVFNKATAGLIGVGYVPLVVAKQVVEGINYRFFCNAKPAYPNAPNLAAMVTIYAPPGAMPHITEINRV